MSIQLKVKKIVEEELGDYREDGIVLKSALINERIDKVFKDWKG